MVLFCRTELQIFNILQTVAGARNTPLKKHSAAQLAYLIHRWFTNTSKKIKTAYYNFVSEPKKHVLRRFRPAIVVISPIPSQPQRVFECF